MKKLYLLAFLLAGYVTAWSQYRENQTDMDRLLWNSEKLNILFDTRVDLENIINNHSSDEFSFKGQIVRIWLVGEIYPGIRYRVRHRLNKLQTPERDGYRAATDHAWVSFDAGKRWTFTVGKQSVQISTFENDYNDADVYLGSMVYYTFDGSMTGVNTAFKPGKQEFNFQVTNSDAPIFANESHKYRAVAFNFMWAGSLFNDVIRTRWRYGTFQHNKDKFYNWLTLGTQLNIGHFTTEFDYYEGTRQADYGDLVMADSLGYRYVHDQSISLNLKYNFGKWRPFVKGIWDKRYDKEFDDTAYRSLGIQGVVEFYPFTDARLKDLRFHAAYTFKSTDYRGAFNQLPNTNVNTFLVGMRWIFKVK
ncbi:MAG: OprO/OprP family phosphate-selective porin [Tannerellaceae bacterium]|nr:OprO/OprP family phosphate-selective porin [Tannerellaceae bacterium]